jgi:hypothetical protein
MAAAAVLLLTIQRAGLHSQQHTATVGEDADNMALACALLCSATPCKCCTPHAATARPYQQRCADARQQNTSSSTICFMQMMITNSTQQRRRPTCAERSPAQPVDGPDVRLPCAVVVACCCCCCATCCCCCCISRARLACGMFAAAPSCQWYPATLAPPGKPAAPPICICICASAACC